MPFADITGHPLVLDLLRQAVRRGRMPQSLLFAGPEGVGKRAVAVALAQAVNCPVRLAAEGDDACGRCPTCERIAAGRHSDVVFLEKGDEASIKIKALRERVLEVVGYRPFEAAYRVYVIDPADGMRWETQDALLKTLEEPPGAAILVLVSARPDMLLPTIQSRCRRVRFGPLADADVVRVLTERLDVDPARARMLAAVAGGSVGRAMSEDAGALDDDRTAAMALLTAARGDAIGARLKAATSMVQHGTKRRDRDALGARLALTSALLRDLTLLGTGQADGLSNSDLGSALENLRSSYGPDRIDAAFDAVGRARQALDRYASPKIVADWVAVTL